MTDEWLREAINGINGRLDRMHDDYQLCRQVHDGEEKALDVRVRILETGMAAMSVKIGALVAFIVIGTKVALTGLWDWLKG